MAEAVKNNSRKRRPPSHLRGYGEEFEAAFNQNGASREQSRQNVDPCSLPIMAKLLVKFVNLTNKKVVQDRDRNIESEESTPDKRNSQGNLKGAIIPDRYARNQDKSSGNRGNQSSSKLQGTIRQDASRYQDKNPKLNTNISLPASSNTAKQPKSTGHNIDLSLKNRQGPSIEDIHKLSRDQLMKSLPKGQEYFQKAGMTLTSENGLSKNLQGKIKGKQSQFKKNTKLFKRGSFHVGIAYSIHIQNVKKRNPNFTPQELDPTYVSRKMKEQSIRYVQQQNRIQSKLLQKQAKQKQTNQKNMKEYKAQQEFQKMDVEDDLDLEVFNPNNGLQVQQETKKRQIQLQQMQLAQKSETQNIQQTLTNDKKESQEKELPPQPR